MSFVLLNPVGASSSSSTVKIGPVTVATTDTDAVDTLACAFTTVKWLLTVTDLTVEDQHAIEIYARCKPAGIGPADVKHQCYAGVGDYIDYGIGVVLSGANMELRITNNTANSLTVTLVRIQVS